MVLRRTVADRGGPAPGFVVHRAPPRREIVACRVPQAEVLHNNRLQPSAACAERAECLARRGAKA
jgi:hypothetical protein